MCLFRAAEEFSFCLCFASYQDAVRVCIFGWSTNVNVTQMTLLMFLLWRGAFFPYPPFHNETNVQEWWWWCHCGRQGIVTWRAVDRLCEQRAFIIYHQVHASRRHRASWQKQNAIRKLSWTISRFESRSNAPFEMRRIGIGAPIKIKAVPARKQCKSIIKKRKIINSMWIHLEERVCDSKKAMLVFNIDDIDAAYCKRVGAGDVLVMPK